MSVAQCGELYINAVRLCLSLCPLNIAILSIDVFCFFLLRYLQFNRHVRVKHSAIKEQLQHQRSDAVDVGDFSLTLREPQLLDSGVYICSIRQETGEKILTGIQLNVKGQIFLVLLILLPVSGGLLFHFRHYFMSGEFL
uniref:Uncharacterized protein n=1 Tax=Poecilia reticulata TaxID=8081 RepID=A0A3P9PY95_POERE